jgi:hypothetical protein
MHIAPGLAGHGSAPTAASWWSQIGYGVSFALASLSCTIAPFLAVTAGALSAGGPLGVASAFLPTRWAWGSWFWCSRWPWSRPGPRWSDPCAGRVR